MLLTSHCWWYLLPELSISTLTISSVVLWLPDFLFPPSSCFHRIAVTCPSREHYTMNFIKFCANLMVVDARPAVGPVLFSVHYLICSVWFRWLHARFSSRHILTLLFWLFYGFYFLSPHSSLHASLHSYLLSFPQNCTRPSEPPVLSIPFIGMIVIVALIWCWWEELAS